MMDAGELKFTIDSDEDYGHAIEVTFGVNLVRNYLSNVAKGKIMAMLLLGEK